MLFSSELFVDDFIHCWIFSHRFFSEREVFGLITAAALLLRCGGVIICCAACREEKCWNHYGY